MPEQGKPGAGRRRGCDEKWVRLEGFAPTHRAFLKHPAADQRVQNLLTHRLAIRIVILHGKMRGNISNEHYDDSGLNRIPGELDVAVG